MRVKISLVQFARDDRGKDRNIERMAELLKGVERTDVVCLPENWIGREPLSEDECKALISVLSEVASENDFNLLTGGAYICRGEGIFDSCYVIDRRGEIVGFCDKIFPSRAVGEREFLSGGKEMLSFELEGLKIGVAICIDAVYPEIVRTLASKGAEIVFNPSNIPENRLEMWKHIGVTRAVENGIHFVFLNNTSTSYLDGRKITGHSFIVSPEGEMLLQLDERERVITHELDLTKTTEVRAKWSFLKDILESEGI